MIFYTADLHFGHTNIIESCGRPFSNIDQMNETLIKNWNSVVSAEDTVYILGDFAYRSAVSMKSVLRRLNGIKHLVVGNHDTAWMKNIELDEFFASVSNLIEIEDGDVQITLCHYPLLSWNRMSHGTLHIHGHIHTLPKEKSAQSSERNFAAFKILKDMNAYNAGVDVNNFAPATLEQLKANKQIFYTIHNIK